MSIETRVQYKSAVARVSRVRVFAMLGEELEDVLTVVPFEGTSMVTPSTLCVDVFNNCDGSKNATIFFAAGFQSSLSVVAPFCTFFNHGPIA